MLSTRDRNRLRAIAALAPPGPTVVVAGSPDGDALEAAATLLAAGRTKMSIVGPFDPLALRAALSRRELYGRVHATIGPPVSVSSQRQVPATLLCIAAADLSPTALRAYGNGWARHLQAGGYLALLGASAPSLHWLGVTPAYWQAWPERRPIVLARRKPVG
jgi:hypothetical protein